MTLLERVRTVGEQADARATETEILRRLPDDLAAALVDTGLLRAWVPADYGGGADETDVRTVIDAVEELAFHDGATAWCGMIGASTSLTAGLLPPDWAKAIYGDPRAVTGGFAMPAGRARRVEGGMVVDGHWQWGSFSHHCTWLGGGCTVEGDDGAMPFMFFEPAQVRLLDTWHVAGLKGTGSTDYEVHEAFVPEGRWADIFTGAHPPVVDGPLWRFPVLGLLAVNIAAVALGLARRARHEVVALATAKRPAQSSRTLAERQATQADVARAEAAHRSARAFLLDMVDEAWAAASTGAPLDAEHRRLLRLAATDAVWRSAEAVDLMYTVGGGSSVYESSPLQRVFRDMHTLTQHGMVARRTYEPVGRVALGLPTDLLQL